MHLNKKPVPKSTVCDPNAKDGHGYFTGDKDGITEPLLYINSAISVPIAPSNGGNVTSSNGSNTNTNTGGTNNSANVTNSAPRSPQPPSNNATNTGNATNVGNTTNTGNATNVGNMTNIGGNLTEILGGNSTTNATQSGNNTNNTKNTNATVHITSGDTWYFKKTIGPVSTPALTVDPSTGRIYALEAGHGTVRVFLPNATQALSSLSTPPSNMP